MSKLRPRTWSNTSNRSSKCTKPMRAILDDPNFGEPVVYSGIAETVRRCAGGNVTRDDYWLEGAGLAFEQKYYGHGRCQDGADMEEGSDSEESSEEEETYGKDSKEKEKAGGTFKIPDTLKGVKLYELLNVTEGATQDEIKKSYRNLVLTAHPDKVGAKNEKEAKRNQERFVQIQEAYELLSHPRKRLQYDSTLDFDDRLPKFNADSKADFFEVFGECFRRNARWSVRRPVPEIGDANTDPKEWKRFYDFWHEFVSWRDPYVLAEKDGEEMCNLEEAECREEKRWMMRENNRIAKKYKQAERDRICDLVRMAEKWDPRIQAEKDAKKAARAAEAAKREEERTAVQRAKLAAELERRKAEEAAAAAEAKRRAEEKAAREEIKNEVKKCRQRLRTLQASVKELVSLEQVNEVCLALQEPALRFLGDEVEEALKEGLESAKEVFFNAIETIGLTPIAPKESSVSTASGPPSEDDRPVEVDPAVLAARKKKMQEQERARKQREEQEAEEKARLAAIKAEEKRKREELKKQETAKEDAKKRQAEKKDNEKAKKAEARDAKQQAAEAAQKERHREEAKERALQQAEKDRQAAEALKAEQEMERVVKLFEADRTERLQKLDAVQNDSELLEALQSAASADGELHAAVLSLRKESNSGSPEEAELDKAVALICKVGPIWQLALAPPPDITLHSTIRNKVKKARGRLRVIVSNFITKVPASPSEAAAPNDWQRGIIDGSIAVPVWTAEEREAELKKAQEAAVVDEAAQQGKKGKKAKEAKAPQGEEDLDSLLAEFGVSPEASKKKSKNKKK
eukprot:gnl/TRDRNA2_/TRDRNA2_184631_c0_seq1.p1 gnl/TRDRNA2_/TRDRNA2_184631_c0~~gnl/TRDRNA2_/TRDRNA2_184631_c0_seq1.p1  ORF type:complete len:802 (+),score=274.64 gnl/TRDRNA2_/TRDRNA2_184631_c0_seq1:77-2482(+)